MFDELRDLYSEQIRAHGRRPTHGNLPSPADASARGDNPMCGDRVEVAIRRDGGMVTAAGFKGRGCEISIASADLMCEVVPGLQTDRVRALAGEVETLARDGVCPACDGRLEILQPLSAVHRYPSRIKCVTLPWRALVAALEGGKEATSE